MMLLNDSEEWRASRERGLAVRLPKSMGDLLSSAASKFGDKTAIDFFESGESLSFRNWDQQANRLASGLQAIGVRKGMHVGVMLRNFVEFPIAWMAIARLGAVIVPINTSYTPSEIEYVVKDAEIAFLIVEAVQQDKIAAVRVGISEFPQNCIVVVGASENDSCTHHWGAIMASNSANFTPDAPILRSDLLGIQYTSGTTGFPKGCMQTHEYWLICALNMIQPDEFFDTGSMLGEGPLFYLDGFWMMARTLALGTTLFQAERMSLRKNHGRLVATQAEVALTPLLRDDPLPQEKTHNIRVFLSIGASREECFEIERRYGAKVREGYGMTEIGLALSVPLEISDSAIIGTCGLPNPTYEMKIVDTDGVEVPPGQPGELWVCGPGVIDGYWKKPEANADSFVNGWFRTGDIFERTKQGWYRYVGRIKDMIKRSGENISAAEVEAVIRTYRGIEEVAVFPVPHKLRGEEVKAAITLADGIDPSTFDFEALRAHCEADLARFKLPRYLEIVDAFEHTPSRKVIKANLIKNNNLNGNWDYELAGRVE